MTGRKSALDRIDGAVPLASVFLWLSILYAWQAYTHSSPWIFGDELQLTQISRSIAHTGHGARRGQPYSFHTLYTILTAPAWWIGSTSTAYSVVKYIGVFTMTASVFPAYFLARLIASPRASLFAAAATGAAPALAYSAMILPEPLAYTWSALALFLLAKGLATRSWRWLVPATAASILAPLVRSELAVLLAVYLIAVLFLLWTSERAHRWRSGWSRGDWLGAVTLGIVAIVVVNAAISSASHEWLIATGYYQGRIVEYGLWAAGALTIGLGLLPVVVGLAVLFRPRSEQKPPGLRAFSAVFAASVVAFGLYGAVKAAYISTNYATLVEERNLIYLGPLLFVATALWLDRPHLRLLPLAASVGFVAYLIASTPYRLSTRISSDALGLSILELTNRDLSFADSGVRWLLIGTLVVSAALLLAPQLLVGRRLALGGVLALATALVLAWNVTGEVSASNASNDFARNVIQNFPRPLNWLDRATGNHSTLYLGQGINSGAALGISLMEFWNPSLKQVWSLDGTAPGPGPTLTPNLADPLTGRLSPDPGLPYAVTEAGVDVVGRPVGHFGRWSVFQITPPLRLAHSETGVTAGGEVSQIYVSDRQTGCDSLPCSTARAAYNQYSTAGEKPGWLSVSVSRLNTCQAPIKPATVVVRIGELVKGQDKQPHLGRIVGVRRFAIDVHQGAVAERTIVMPVPRPPFRAVVSISPTYSPADFGASDRRHLGAQVGFSFSETTSPETRHRCS